MLGIVKKTYRPATGRKEWALLSRNTQRPLKWWGTKKPTSAMISKQERRVKFYKNQNRAKSSLQLITVEEFSGLRGDVLPSRLTVGLVMTVVGFLAGWSLASPN